MMHISIAWCTFLCQREVLRQIRKRIVWGLVLISTHYQSQTLCRPLPAHIVQAEALIMRPACRLAEEIKKIPIRNSFAVNYCLWEVFGCDSCFYSSQLWMWVRETLKGEIAFWSEITFWSMTILYTEPTIVRTSLDMITINHRLTNSW